jgi:uncharacterized protein (TIGR00251 family)
LAADDSNTVTRLYIRVTPNASRNEVTGYQDGVLCIRIAAAPRKGKANKELIAYLGRRLDTGRSSVHLLKGHTSRNKVIAVNGLSQEDIIRRISP